MISHNYEYLGQCIVKAHFLDLPYAIDPENALNTLRNPAPEIVYHLDHNIHRPQSSIEIIVSGTNKIHKKNQCLIMSYFKEKRINVLIILYYMFLLTTQSTTYVTFLYLLIRAFPHII